MERGAQVSTLHDTDLLARLEQAGVALVLVHAVNPHGFSHLHRTNEDNIDLNRNHIDFGAPLPVNAQYAEVEPLVLPATWPPTAADEAAMAALMAADLEYYTPSKGEREGSPEGFFDGQRANFPEATVTVDHLMAEGDMVAAYTSWTGTFQGDKAVFFGEELDIPEFLRN